MTQRLGSETETLSSLPEAEGGTGTRQTADSIDPSKFGALEQRVGKYRLLERIGEGGSGSVYAAIEDGANEEVALKILRNDVPLSEKEVERFLKEAERLKRIKHPNLVRFREAGVLPDGRPYLAMDLVRGETLSKKLMRGRLPVEQSLRILHDLSLAVEALHAVGLVHRDIKPENVLIDPDERPILLDLGIAQDDTSVSTTTLRGEVRGTPAYMAPERFFGVRASIQSDVYELALIGYNMITGTLPWADPENAHLRLQPTDPCKLEPSLSRPLGDAFLVALSSQPQSRPSDTARLRALLDGHRDTGRVTRLTGVIPNEIRSIPPDPSTRTSRRLLVGAGVLGIALLGAGAIEFRGRAKTGAAASLERSSFDPSAAPVPTVDRGSSLAPAPSSLAVFPLASTMEVSPREMPATSAPAKGKEGVRVPPAINRSSAAASATNSKRPVVRSTTAPAATGTTSNSPSDLYLDRK